MHGFGFQEPSEGPIYLILAVGHVCGPSGAKQAPAGAHRGSVENRREGFPAPGCRAALEMGPSWNLQGSEWKVLTGLSLGQWVPVI